MKKSLPQQIKDSVNNKTQQLEEKLDWEGRQTLSTGSTTLDLAISGLKTRYGGLPGGKFVEIFGDSGLGKTTIAGEIAGNCQRTGGEVKFDDPEYRLEPSYCKIMGIRYDPTKFGYPDTITDVEESMIGPIVTKKGGGEIRDEEKAWRPDPKLINVLCEDSLSALCSRMERTQGDKRGQKRAKDFHQMFRLITNHIPKYNILMVATNQIIDVIDPGLFGPKTTTSGGHAIKFYADLRIELRPRGVIKSGDVIIGKKVEAFIFKSSLDIEWRKADLYMIHGYGIDNIRGNIMYLKEHGAMNDHPTDPSKKAGYVIGDKNFVSIDQAIAYVEDNNLEEDLKEAVVDLWNELESKARPKRKEKVR